MNKFAKMTILAIASAAAVSAPLATASADSWGRRDWHGGGWHQSYSHHRHNRTGDAVAAGVIGLAAGALIGSALSQPQQRVYVEPAPVYAPPPPPAYYPAPPARAVQYRADFEPWSRSWYDYCSDRYRSFNPTTGTYRGYDGQDHFCTAN
ncbi:BA14K family protein [Falsochrobactrum shanghaiense]|uniref:Lectin-like protein BA14k n=1 Tax=Falsochrobactrum shanghaiense TaxID=2201899 RepID=A0A316J5R8_9HYPH|nr:BA14K family protein [Falsochrobactrum shanghaiense]PWL17272.1 BA14K family protein [Falsochrobactrum shanghaiense]